MAPVLCGETACGVSDGEMDVAEVTAGDVLDDESELPGGSQLSKL